MVGPAPLLLLQGTDKSIAMFSGLASHHLRPALDDNPASSRPFRFPRGPLSVPLVALAVFGFSSFINPSQSEAEAPV